MEEASTSNKQTNTKMSVAPELMAVTSQENVQAGVLKNMVLDPGWFNSDQTKFEDW